MDTYTLPNGARIDVSRMTEIVLEDLEGEAYPQVYLDTETGAFVEIPYEDTLRRWVEEVGLENRYFLIERFTDAEKDAIARDFVTEILPVMSPKDMPGARRAHKRGGWREMESFLKRRTDGWEHAWSQYVWDEARQYVEEWLTNSPYFSVTVAFEGCGNCSVCELIRQGEVGNAEKLAEAFATEHVMQNVETQVRDMRRLESKSKPRKK